MKEKKQGGKRKGAGRKSSFSEPTRTVSFRCPLSKIEELKLYVTAKLSEWSAEKHLMDKLPIGDVISCPICGGETTLLEPDKCMTIDCPNCIF